MAVRIQSRLFRVAEYHRMAEAGILTEDERVELLNGEIVQMSPIGSRHAGCVNGLTEIFVQRLAGRAVVSVQNPIELGEDSEPQPDVMVLKWRPDRYRGSLPKPEDVLLVVEVADTTADFDRKFKIPIYARAGIPETWLMDLELEQIEVYQQRSPEGCRSVRIFRRGESIAPSALPDVTLAVDDIL